MTKPPAQPKPKHVIRTAIPGYFFGAMKAADTVQGRNASKRKMSKLPTTLDELNQTKSTKPDGEI